MRKLTRSLVATAAVCLCSLAAAAPALAGSPATVTVRVLGPAPTYEALTPITQVTTTTTPVVKDGGSCPGTTAVGALELATHGDWEGKWDSEFNDYEVLGIDGRSYPFEGPPPYWSFWLNNAESTKGVCEAELESGNQVLFVPESLPEGCFEVPKKACTAPSLLSLAAPATADVGQSATVTVQSYPYGSTSSTAAAGVTVQGGGASATTNAQGQAQLTFPTAGTYTLRATGAAGEEPKAIPGEASVCVHNGNDGTCGTTLVVANGSPEIVSLPPRLTPSPEVPRIAGVANGHIYRRHSAPRVLQGSVTVPTGETLREVLVSLQRKHGKHCFVFNGRRAAFTRAKCDKQSFFKVSNTPSFNYLLPKHLPAGRYVYELEAVNDAGAVTKPAAGVSRVVFDVK
ncbi:MAG TPA: hypothetical protein VMS02_07575 [Solirubrobacteraceae bacterium]|nr:hypothetical protein [Solirubrobacteraceae bacterium]